MRAVRFIQCSFAPDRTNVKGRSMIVSPASPGWVAAGSALRRRNARRPAGFCSPACCHTPAGCPKRKRRALVAGGVIPSTPVRAPRSFSGMRPGRSSRECRGDWAHAASSSVNPARTVSRRVMRVQSARTLKMCWRTTDKLRSTCCSLEASTATLMPRMFALPPGPCPVAESPEGRPVAGPLSPEGLPQRQYRLVSARVCTKVGHSPRPLCSGRTGARVRGSSMCQPCHWWS